MRIEKLGEEKGDVSFSVAAIVTIAAYSFLMKIVNLSSIMFVCGFPETPCPSCGHILRTVGEIKEGDHDKEKPGKWSLN